MSTPVYVSAGSNVDAVRNLKRALAELERHFAPLQVSAAYRNAAVGFDGPEFINLVVGFQTGKSVREVIEVLRGIETLCGRPRSAPRWASRAMDLDILLYGDLVVDESGFKLPRPDLLRRDYMLRPLAEIAGDTRHPVVGKTIAELWAGFDRSAHLMTRVDLDDSLPA